MSTKPDVHQVDAAGVERINALHREVAALEEEAGQIERLMRLLNGRLDDVRMRAHAKRHEISTLAYGPAPVLSLA